jgi:hypothetical protein
LITSFSALISNGGFFAMKMLRPNTMPRAPCPTLSRAFFSTATSLASFSAPMVNIGTGVFATIS